MTRFGFAIRSVVPLPALRLCACEAEHLGTGAQVLHLVADDAENLFCVAFLTPPTDDTGVAHILEHAVLSGSRRFPVRDPFFEMVKISMATFINAMTATDHTIYPVSSNVKQDLFNLAEVYFDAVFHPLLDRDAFRREGHHLAPCDPDDPTAGLTIDGIVFNEMKAALSRPESRLYYLTARHLLAGSTYGYLSGGDPDQIPRLTYEELKQFHARHYHPSNAKFVFYGDIPTDEYLAFLEPRLAEFDRSPFRPAMVRPPAWERPRSVRDSYAVGAEEPTSERTFLQMAWHGGDALDAERNMLLQILSTLLLGDDAAPLKKALVDSHLGLDVLPGGAGADGTELLFVVGLRGSEPERADAFRSVVLRTLEEVAAGPLDPERVEAAFHKQSYECLEIPSHYPLVLMNQVTDSWLYGRDPLLFVRQADILKACRRRYQESPAVFGRLIREVLLDNPHRVDVILEPDRDWQRRAEEGFRARMRDVQARLGEADLRRVAEEAADLQRKSAAPTPPEALARLPQLRVQDIPRRPTHIPTAVESLPGGGVFLRNDVFANGVNYLLLNFDLKGLPAERWPDLPRYEETLLKLGAAGCNYETMARRVAAHTGGIECRSSLSRRIEPDGQPCWGLRLSVRVLDEQIGPALDILRDLIFDPDPRDVRRFGDVLLQSLAGLRASLVNGGPSTALRHILQGVSPEGFLQERMAGLSQLDRVERLSRDLAKEFESLVERVLDISSFLRNARRITASFTGSDPAADRVRATLATWLASMPGDPPREQPIGFRPAAGVERIGLAAPLQVAHCVQAVPSLPPGHADLPLLLLGLGMVGLDYMVHELRLQGHAYGAGCHYAAPGVVALTTYADPHITRTLRIFEGLPRYVREVGWTQTEINRGIINTAKRFLAPIRPEEATESALARHLTGQTREFREAQYERLLGATPSATRRVLLETFEAGLPRAPVCVMAGRDHLERANREMPETPLRIEELLKADGRTG